MEAEKMSGQQMAFHHLLCIRTPHKGSCWCAGACTVHMCRSRWCRESGKNAYTPRPWHWHRARTWKRGHKRGECMMRGHDGSNNNNNNGEFKWVQPRGGGSVGLCPNHFQLLIHRLSGRRLRLRRNNNFCLYCKILYRGIETCFLST